MCTLCCRYLSLCWPRLTASHSMVTWACCILADEVVLIIFSRLGSPTFSITCSYTDTDCLVILHSAYKLHKTSHKTFEIWFLLLSNTSTCTLLHVIYMYVINYGFSSALTVQPNRTYCPILFGKAFGWGCNQKKQSIIMSLFAFTKSNHSYNII